MDMVKFSVISVLRLRKLWPCMFFFCAVLAAGGFSPAPASAIPMKAGMVIDVTQGAMAESAEGARMLALRGSIFVGDVLKTDGTGSMQVLFDDNSILAIAEDSEVTINRFVYSGKGTAVSKTESDTDGSGSSGSTEGSSVSVSSSNAGAAATDSSTASESPESGRASASTTGDTGTASAASSSASASAAGSSVAGSFSSASADAAASTVGDTGSAIADSGSTSSPVAGSSGTSADPGLPSDENFDLATWMGSSAVTIIIPPDPDLIDSDLADPDSGGAADGLGITVNDGSAMFGSGVVCNSGQCDIASLGGSAGVGGKEGRVMAAMDGSRTMLLVTASKGSMTSEISALAVGRDMQVMVSGAGLAAQALSQQSTVTLGGGTATVTALDLQKLQGQMDQITTASSAMSSSQIAATTKSLDSAGLTDATVSMAATDTSAAKNVSRQNTDLGNGLKVPEAKMVGTASSSLSPNQYLGVVDGMDATLTKLDVSSTVDFTNNKLLQYTSKSIVEYSDGVNTTEIQTELALKGAADLSKDTLNDAETKNILDNKNTILSDTIGGGTADDLKRQLDSGLDKNIARDVLKDTTKKGKF